MIGFDDEYSEYPLVLSNGDMVTGDTYVCQKFTAEGDDQSMYAKPRLLESLEMIGFYPQTGFLWHKTTLDITSDEPDWIRAGVGFKGCFSAKDIFAHFIEFSTRCLWNLEPCGWGEELELTEWRLQCMLDTTLIHPRSAAEVNSSSSRKDPIWTKKVTKTPAKKKRKEREQSDTCERNNGDENNGDEVSSLFSQKKLRLARVVAELTSQSRKEK